MYFLFLYTEYENTFSLFIFVSFSIFFLNSHLRFISTRSGDLWRWCFHFYSIPSHTIVVVSFYECLNYYRSKWINKRKRCLMVCCLVRRGREKPCLNCVQWTLQLIYQISQELSQLRFCQNIWIPATESATIEKQTGRGRRKKNQRTIWHWHRGTLNYVNPRMLPEKKSYLTWLCRCCSRFSFFREMFTELVRINEVTETKESSKQNWR